MQKRFLEQLQTINCLQKKVLIAVSGGIDSIVLLELFIKSGYKVAIAHVNFQLRGEESDQDEAFVTQLAKSYHIPSFSKRFETKNYATANSISIQMAARELRYDWFSELLESEKYDYLATAHHLNDNLETVLINFVRGSGLSGLRGIQLKSNRIIRPLLNFSRHQIETFALSHNLKWREDSSNTSDDYVRNFIRHQVIPKLKEINPSLEETFTRNNERLSAAKELMDLGIEHLKSQFLSETQGQVKILKTMFDVFPKAAILYEVVKEYGFNLAQCEEIVKSIHGQPGKRFLSPYYQLIVDRESLFIAAHSVQWQAVNIEEDQERALLGSWELNISTLSNQMTEGDPFIAQLDKDKLTYPLVWRPWKEGDWFHPLGMDHKKKVSDFLIDSKASINEKDRVTVVESDGQIVWLAGHRIDNRCKLVASTKSILRLQLKSFFV